jgi:hypothetical protein
VPFSFNHDHFSAPCVARFLKRSGAIIKASSMIWRDPASGASSMAESRGARIMTPKPLAIVSAAALLLAAVLPVPAGAWTPGGGGPGLGSGPKCKTGGVTINKWININKPVTITNNANIWKDITINNDINIQKNIWINKNITINKGNVDVSAQAFAFASAGAQASSSSGGGGYVEEVNVNRGGGVVGQAQASQSCEMQEATVVKAVHAVCIAPDGREFPASHMLPDTWVEASYEGEIARCIPGAYVKVVIGDVVQSDQGMAGLYEHGQTLVCAEHEALRHYKDGMLKCAAVVPVKDCTERTNLRKYGTGDLFFSYRSKVCATPAREARTRAIELTGMSLEGGVGPGY